MKSLFVICCTFALLVLPIVLGASVGNDNDNGNDNGNVIDNSKRSGPGNVVTNEKTESNNNATCEVRKNNATCEVSKHQICKVSNTLICIQPLSSPSDDYFFLHQNDHYGPNITITDLKLPFYT